MSLLSGNNKNNKKGGKGAKTNQAGAKGAIKGASKPAAFAKKPMKTGGTRGS
ncbi:MAG: hypothetical protein JSS82_13195 [Bacteroidetes bacterium]|jgi:hypothetical protein|nr:hypothetical protein [Bacteroidota bacterium]